jgi:hypothetical protein
MKNRFNQWLVMMDEHDRNLGAKQRRQKWLAIVGLLMLCFLASFFLFPPEKISHQSLEPNKTGSSVNPVDSLPKQSDRRFDLPADSFEQLLKHEIDERLPEK